MFSDTPGGIIINQIESHWGISSSTHGVLRKGFLSSLTIRDLIVEKMVSIIDFIVNIHDELFV